MEKLTSIILLSYNTLAVTKLCVESIRKFTAKGSYEIIMIDNASKDGSVEWLREQKDIACVFNKQNEGFPRACNQGLAMARGTELLLLNNDTIVTPHWLENLLAALYSRPSVGAVGCMTNSCSNRQALESVPYGEDWDALEAFARAFNQSDPAKWDRRLKLVGFCLLFKREVMERIGYLDERFTPGNFEDDDYSFRIWQAGYELLLCKDTFIHHFGHASFVKEETDEQKLRFNALLKRNFKVFQSKWPVLDQYLFHTPHDPDGLLEFLRRSEDKEKTFQARRLDPNKICFITAINDEAAYNDCLTYLRRLAVPDGMQVESRAVAEASSMAEAYQEGMLSSDAKYKVYLHQDVHILHRRFLIELVRAFRSNVQYGIMGVVGNRVMPSSGMWREGGALLGAVQDDHTGTMEMYMYRNGEREPMEAAILDGFLLATQYDVPWRADVFDKWHFYDASQCVEFQRHGYRVGVLPQKVPWVHHGCGQNAMRGYDTERDKFLAVYGKECEAWREIFEGA